MSLDNGFRKVCEAFVCPVRGEPLRHLMAIDMTEFLRVGEPAGFFRASASAASVHLKKLAAVGQAASGLDVKTFAARAEMLPQAGNRFPCGLNIERTVDSNGQAQMPANEPKATLHEIY